MLTLDVRGMDHHCQQMINFPPSGLWGVPSLDHMIADHPRSTRIDFPSLVSAATGAAPIAGESRKHIEAMLQRTVLSGVYGMTEAGQAIIANSLDRSKPKAVGLPISGLDARIVAVESGTREMPCGQAGENVFSSPCIIKYYHNFCFHFPRVR